MRPCLVLLVPFHLMACWGTDGRLALSEENVRDEMVEHHREVLAARDSVIAGELTDARAALAALDKRLPLPGLEAEAQRELGLAVLRGTQASDLDGVALAVGEAGARCGACHRLLNVKPPAEAGPVPQVTNDMASQMSLHRWALLRMWDGLIRAEDAAFVEAAAALNKAPMVPSGLPIDGSPHTEVTQLEVRVHDLAASAARAGDLASKGRDVGKMLSTCQQCHLLTGGGPK